jgi:alkyl sulfatase BDS1-like metallo-beta-lactamase superfamily hydrolase
VHPGLWRQAKLNSLHGLYKVTDGIYQLRGYDLAVMSIIESKNGWIVVDPLTSRETATRAMAFARKHLGNKPWLPSFSRTAMSIILVGRWRLLRRKKLLLER